MLLLIFIGIRLNFVYSILIDETLNATEEAYHYEHTKLEVYLMKNYSRWIRPVKDTKFQTDVHFSAMVYHIQELDELEGKISVRGALYMEWVDYFLTWNKEDFNNVSRLFLPSYSVWRPNLLVYNAADNVSESPLPVWNSHVYLYSSGRVVWTPPFSFVASCSLNFDAYPYDIQECPIAVGPWSYNHRELEFIVYSDAPDIWMTFNDTKTVVSGWEILGIKQRRGWWDPYNQTFVWKKPEPDDTTYFFPIVELTPKLKRHIPYFRVTAILPSVAFSILTVLSFIITNLQNRALVLIINLILQIIFSDDLLRILPPTTNNIPDIVQYFAWNLVLTIIAIISFVILEGVKSRNVKMFPIPRFLTIAVNIWLSLKVRCKCHIEERETTGQADTENVEVATTSVKGMSPKKGQSWKQVVDAISDIIFVTYSIIYVILMFVYLK